MYSRIINTQNKQSFFLFGPRGVGKSSWLRSWCDLNNYIDLLDDETFNQLQASPKDLIHFVRRQDQPIIIDEVQKIPKLLDEVHRLIELKKIKFILTGSSARKLKANGANLLAGRALTYSMHPLTSVELKEDFNFKKNVKIGCLPMAVTTEVPKKYLSSYVKTYLKEEVQLEGLTRNIAAFSRFLQAASFSQASPLNISAVARDCAVERKVVEDYFSILRDLYLSFELPVFSKRAKRELISKSKFFLFDSGVFVSLRPRGPLDSESELMGPAFETLIVQNIRALNDYLSWDYELFYWHTREHQEVDLVLYGPRGLWAIEIKSSSRLRSQDFESLLEFKKDYPIARTMIVYSGSESRTFQGVEIKPAELFFREITNIF